MTDWKKKLAAWLHDPAEKALILMRTVEGHECGTTQRLREELSINFGDFDERADHLAAAADRPNWPRPEDAGRYPAWEQVRFTSNPVLIHPLSGETIELAPLAVDISAAEAKAVSLDHFRRLIQDDARKTFLAFWRFGPELGHWVPEVGNLWKTLPADSRTPDHSIWSHVDTVSALATALDGDRPALLAMSFGPVQGFIAQARSTSDLWAGSHLLSSIVWAALRSVVEAVGPDAVIFPALRGVPAVDAWLLENLGDVGRTLFNDICAEFIADKTDTNPLFAAALPNKFVAVVPASLARDLAKAAIAAAKTRANGIAHDAAAKVFAEAGVEITKVTRDQIEAQLAEFPEAFWAAAIWPVNEDVKDVATSARQLQAVLSAIHPALAKQGVFDDQSWKVLTRELQLDGFQFWAPNAGVFYPAVYELAERLLAAAKAARPFDQLTQEGHRCTQCGEREWLTDDRTKLQSARSMRKPKNKATGEHEVETAWATLADNPKRRAWAKEGEHLCALCTAKRLWPTLFAKEMGEIVGEKIDRFVVSTHALALATSMDRLLDDWSAEKAAALTELSRDHNVAGDEPVTLPKALYTRIRRVTDNNTSFVLKRLPSALERLRDAEDRSPMDKSLKKLFGENNKPETYYALIQMDGDRMGAWLAGNEDEYRLRYRGTWHKQVRAEVDKFAQRDRALKDYIDTFRPSSPAHHTAISQALNDFSIHLVRYIVEDCVKGKLLYAGGDDVLALVAVDDLFDAMQLLRLAYSGLAAPEGLGLADHLSWLGESGRRQGSGRLMLGKGFGLFNGRLMTLMGHKATASMGAVVAHHQTSLGMVLRQLREAENWAKNAGRDRFCIRVLKRGGGEVSVTSPWWPVAGDKRPVVETSALRLMKRLRDELALTDLSRGAIYRAQLWFEGITDETNDSKDPRWRAQVAGSLAYQFKRQKGKSEVAREVVDFVCDVIKPDKPRTALENFLVTAEFFARESRVRKGDLP